MAGLDEAGKSSILLALKREFSKIGIIKPTKLVNRHTIEFLRTKLGIWDLGGQNNYRTEYLKKPDFYFYGTEIVIYVIDIQNQNRIPESISYLNDLIQSLKKIKIYPSVFVLFHKFDPNLENITQLQDNIEKTKEDIKSLIKYSINFFYNTTIYDLSTIISSISEVFLNLYPKAKIIDKAMENFAIKVNAEGAHLIDNNSIIIGAYYKDENAKDLLIKSTHHFLTLGDFFSDVKTQENGSEDQINIQKFGKYFIFRNLSLDEGKIPYYLLLFKDDPEYSEEDYNALITLLNEILNK